MPDIYKYLSNSIPRDHCKQMNSQMVVTDLITNGFRVKSILDFGCGEGKSIDLFNNLIPEAKWTGVDIDSSPEVNSRIRNDAHFVTYDGYELPFKNGSYDLVYYHQVLEHVRKPELVLREISRVLKSDGIFVGQTSQLEPYHSFSLWNFTIYGFKKIVEDAGMKVISFRPSIDGFTLIERSYKGKPLEYSRFFNEESPFNKEIENNALNESKSAQIINHRKLQLCGQFCFTAVKA